MNKNILKVAVVNSAITALYVILVASFLFYSGSHKLGQSHSFLIPISMLMLLVFSIAFVGTSIFGRPIFWYMDGKKKEALVLLAYTLAFFFVVTLVFLLFLLV